MKQIEIILQVILYLDRTKKTQSEFASEIGASPVTVHRWLKGKATISKAYRMLLKSKGIIQ